VDIAKDLLKKHKFIVLKSFGVYLNKAFMVAGILGDELDNLEQVNIPKTVQVL
jgi:hypothetical protein